MTRLGFTAPVFGFDVRASAQLARRAEEIGYTDCWSAETSGPDGFSVASAVGVMTESMRVGVAIAPVFTRPPALMAMSALAAYQASQGRFCLGLGASSPVIVEGWMGESLEKPVARMRETVAAVRAAFAVRDRVRAMDDALNNTSVILLFEFGTRKLLFPGDAQIENWSYALSRKADLAMLADTDVYKVGHHGSHNATLKANGVSEIFLPGTSTQDIVSFINDNVRPR